MPRKVVCIDATPIPIFLGAGEDIPEFTFPNGFIQEGTTYVVERSVLLSNNTTGYILLSTPILADGYPTSWHSSRFRELATTTASHRMKTSQKLRKLKSAPGDQSKTHAHRAATLPASVPRPLSRHAALSRSLAPAMFYLR